MEGQLNPVENINTSINELERYTFENKQNRYNNLKVITNYLRSELDNLSHELNEDERNTKIAKIEETVNNLTTSFQTYEFPTASIDENTGEIVVNDDNRHVNLESQMLETSETNLEPEIPTPSEAIDVENSQFNTDSQVYEVETPMIETEAPMVETEAPMVETETPMIETETPMVEADEPIIVPEVPQINAFENSNENQEVNDYMAFGSQVPTDEMIDVNNVPQGFDYQPVENIEQNQDIQQENVDESNQMALDEQALDAFLSGNSGVTL